jgi:RNA polymerase sigma factor (sigma-70 family)
LFFLSPFSNLLCHNIQRQNYTQEAKKMQTEDSYFIQKCLNGESEAFGFLVDKYKASVYYFLLSRLRNVHDAEDVSQKVFLRAYERLKHLKRWESFAKWLYSIAYTQSRNFIREKHNRPDRESFEEQDPSIMINHSIDSYNEEQAIESIKETVDEALNSLPEMYREVLVLHYIGGMQNKEIAVILGTSIDNIKQRLSRARSMLKEEVLAMMSVAYDQQQKLTAKFTFHIMEIIKKLKIHPVSTTKGVPWGLSLATGLIIAVMSINPALINFTHIGTPVYAPLLSETKVLKIGEIPVDVVKTSNMPILSGKMGKGNGGEPKKPDMQNAFFLAPKGEGGEWAKKTDMPSPRGALSSSVVNGKIYAIGGMLAEGTAIATMDEYDPTTDKWTKKADMATVRVHFSANTVNGKIYAIGGGNLSGPLASVEEYDPIADKWTKKADMPTPRSNFSSSVVDGKIYAIGGRNNNGHVPAVEEYDPALDKWTKKSNMSKARSYFTACALNGKIYALGGWIPNEQLSSVEEYDPIADKWTKKTNMPITNSAFAICALNEKIYVFGGLTPDGGNQLSVVEKYDPTTDKWTKMPDMPIARSYISASVVNGKAYIMGGQTDSTTVEEYTPEDLQISAISPQGKLPTSWGDLKSR